MIKKFFRKRKKYKNRFLKHYHLHKEEMLKKRKLTYHQRKAAGRCIRCQQPAVKDIVYCVYHREKQREYNKKARN
jgi:hypothetical protein